MQSPISTRVTATTVALLATLSIAAGLGATSCDGDNTQSPAESVPSSDGVGIDERVPESSLPPNQTPAPNPNAGGGGAPAPSTTPPPP